MDLHVDGATKSHFKFNEVTSLTGVKPYVLRFWESEFDQIEPQINEAGQKFYSHKDLEAIDKIKKLLFDEKLSIPQAKGYMDRETMVESKELNSNDLTICVETTSNDLHSYSIEERSLDLKKALDQIIENNSQIVTDTQVTPIEEKALSQIEAEDKAKKVVDSFKSDANFQRYFKDSDIVKLISAKKKLTSLIGKISDISDNHNW